MARADGFAQGQLGGPRATSRHQQAGDVGAGDQQDQRRRAHQHQQRAAHISHHYLGEEFSMTVVVALRPGVDFRQVAHNRVEIRSGGGERDPWLQSPDTADRTMLPAAGRFALEPAQRKVIIRASQCPQRSRHAGNLVRFAVDRQGGSDDVRIAAELALPELMAQHDQRGRAGKVVLRAEEAAEERVHAVERVIRRRDGQPERRHGIAAPGKRAAEALKRGHFFEGSIAVAPVIEVAPGDAEVGLGVGLAQVHQPFRIGVGKRLDQYCVHHAENRGVHAHPERESQDHHERKRRRPAHGPETVTYVVQQALESHEGPCLVGVLGYRGGVAEVSVRRRTGGFRIHAALH